MYVIHSTILAPQLSQKQWNWNWDEPTNLIFSILSRVLFRIFLFSVVVVYKLFNWTRTIFFTWLMATASIEGFTFIQEQINYRTGTEPKNPCKQPCALTNNLILTVFHFRLRLLINFGMLNFSKTQFLPHCQVLNGIFVNVTIQESKLLKFLLCQFL